MLRLLLAEAQKTLGQDFAGMYLYGSLSSGDFNPRSSDIDFLIVTARELPQERVQALKEMHARIAASGLEWAKELEGSYIPLADLRRYDPAHAMHPSIGVDWDFGVNSHGSDWIIQRCLDKAPENRFQSARDLAFSLSAMAARRAAQPQDRAAAPQKRRRALLAVAAALVVLAVGLAAFLAGRFAGLPTPPSWQQLTFRRGMVLSARFGPDSRTIVYGAAWQGQPAALYSVRPCTAVRLR